MGRLAQGQFHTPRLYQRAWGSLERFPIAAPAQGKPWVWVVPSTYIFRLVALRVSLVASVQVANRFPGVALKDPRGVTYYEAATSGETVASGTTSVSVVETPSVLSTVKGIPQVIPIPPILLPPEWVLEGVTTGLQTEDQYSAVQVLAEQYEPNPDHPIADIEHKAHALRLLETAVDLATT